MNIQEIYDSLTPSERQEFARKNAEVITKSLICDDGIDLSGYSKEELLRVIKERGEIYDVINGMLYAGFDLTELRSWLEKQ